MAKVWQEDRMKRLRFQYLFVCFMILKWMPLLCWKWWNPFQRTCHLWISWVSGCLENKPSAFPSIPLTSLSVDWKRFWVMCVFMFWFWLISTVVILLTRTIAPSGVYTCLLEKKKTLPFFYSPQYFHYTGEMQATANIIFPSLMEELDFSLQK